MASLGSLLGPIGGLVGSAAASGDQSSDLAARQAALAAYTGLNPNDIQQLQLNQEAVQGTLTPAQEATMQQQQSGLLGISTDPRLKQAQMNALNQLGQLGQGGLTATEKANLYNITNQSQGNAEAASKAITANMAARGMGGGGAELAARLAAAQGAANTGASNALGVAGQSQNNALQAMMGAGTLGGQMQQTSFGQQAQQQSAQDAINRFNAANAQQVNAANIASQNYAQQQNLANKQGVANTNVGIQNQQNMQNQVLTPEQTYQQQLAQASGIAGGQNNLAGYYGGQAAATRGEGAAIGSGLGDFASANDGSSSNNSSGSNDGMEDNDGSSGQYGAANAQNFMGPTQGGSSMDDMNSAMGAAAMMFQGGTVPSTANTFYNGGQMNGSAYQVPPSINGLAFGGQVDNWFHGGLIDHCMNSGGSVTHDSPNGKISYKAGVPSYKQGGHVPGTPKVPGNDPVNDTEHALLSPGEVVVPNSVMQSRDPAENAARFVASVLAKHSK